MTKSSFAHGLDRTPTLRVHVKVGTLSLREVLVVKADSVTVGAVCRIRENVDGSKFFKIRITRVEDSFFAGDLV